ncbi:MAG: hypothetical protein JNN11_04925 [Candidatus Doudnabacteria bacterium]|nr:hypothetical protein [Candidatus Doudnabacteria bacterium]
MQTSLAKKIFAAGVTASTVLMGFAPFVKAAPHAVGTNVKTSDGTIWMVMPDGTRRAYTSAGAFLSYGFNSFATVVDANGEDAALPQGAFIPPQDGTIFCATATKASDVQGECSLITGGMKAAFTSEANFSGRGFSFGNAQYGDSSFLTKTTNIDNTTDANRPGVLVNDNGTVKLVGNNGVLGIPDMATFNSWGYSWNKVVPANASDKALPMSGVMAARQAGQLSPTALSSSPVSGSVNAMLASDSPAAGTIAVLSSGAKTVATLAKFTFSGNGTVTQLQLKRTGVSPDAILSNVYLFEGNTRLTDAASVGGSSLVTFSNPNGLFTVSGSKTVSVVVEIPAGTTAGQTVGAQLTSFTVANGSAATVAISGNTMTISQVSDLAYADFNTVTPGNTASEQLDPAAGVEVFRSNVSINQRDMTMSRLILRNIGSAQQADMKNFRLRVDGLEVAQVANMDANGYTYFSFSPVTLKAGTRTISVLADLVGGSSRTFQFQIRSAADVSFTDTQYNQSVSSNDTFPVGSAYAVTIQSGSMTIQKSSDSPSGNVTDGSSGVTLAKYTVTAYGEAQKIETIKAGYTPSSASVGSLRNGRILINGVQYGSTATLASTTAGGTTFTLNYTVQPGTPVTLEIQADMYDNDTQGNSMTNGVTITAGILAGTLNVQKLASLGYINVPTATIAGNTITNVTGSVTFSKNNTYAAQSSPFPQTNYKLAAYNLVGSSSEDVNVNSVNLTVNASGTLASVTDVKIMVAGVMYGTVKSTVATGTAVTFSGSYNLAKNTTVPVEVYANIGTPAVAYGADTFTPSVTVNGTTLNSASTVTATATGQVTTGASASITAAQDPSTPVASITSGNQTKTAAAFKWTTTNDQHTISEVTLYIANNTTVQNVMLKDGSTTVATQPGMATTTFSNLNIVIPANSTKILTVEVQLGNVGFGAGSSNENVTVALQNYKAAPSSTGSISTTYAGVSGNAMYVYKAIPTLANVALPSATLSAGSNTLYKFSVSSGAGTIGWAKFLFTIATSSGVTVTSPQLWDADTNTQISGAASTTYAGGNLSFEFQPATEQQVSGTKTYVVKGTVAITGTGAKTVSTSLTQPTLANVAGASAVTATATPASFVWSDLSAQSHGLTTSDWYRDYLVKNLPTDAQGLSASY